MSSTTCSTPPPLLTATLREEEEGGVISFFLCVFCASLERFKTLDLDTQPSLWTRKVLNGAKVRGGGRVRWVEGYVALK